MIPVVSTRQIRDAAADSLHTARTIWAAEDTGHGYAALIKARYLAGVSCGSAVRAGDSRRAEAYAQAQELLWDRSTRAWAVRARAVAA